MPHLRARLTRSALSGLCLLLLLAAPAVADALLNKTDDNLAIQGYDAVAYFVDGAPRRGDPAFAHDWQGARWLFASAEHLERFAADPEAFAPRYGGFCSGGMSLGVKARIDPEAWAIVDGRLYLAFSEDAIERFTGDVERNIAKANEHWERMRAARP